MRMSMCSVCPQNFSVVLTLCPAACPEPKGALPLAAARACVAVVGALRCSCGAASNAANRDPGIKKIIIANRSKFEF